MSKHNTAWLNEETQEIHTPKGRMVWPTLFTPKGIKGKADSKAKFSVTLLLPKSADIGMITTAIVEAAQSKFGKDWKSKKLLLPLMKSVDEPKFAELADDFPFFLRCSASADYPPFVFGPDAKRYQGEQSEAYSGRWAVVAGNAYAYDNVSKGVNFGFNRIQLLDHDDAIAGGRVETASGFEPVAAGASSGGKASSADDLF